MNEEYIARIGNRNVWGGSMPFGLSRVDRRQHTYVVGKTGSGKTTLLRNLILQDIEAGHGVGVLDPHGDLAEDLLNHIPPSRTDDVLYFNPADQENPIGFNLLRSVSAENRQLVASGIVSAFKHLWRDSWGPRLEYILYASVAALLDVENATILGVGRMRAIPTPEPFPIVGQALHFLDQSSCGSVIVLEQPRPIQSSTAFRCFSIVVRDLIVLT